MVLPVCSAGCCCRARCEDMIWPHLIHLLLRRWRLLQYTRTSVVCVFRIGGGQGQQEKSLFYQKIGPVSLYKISSRTTSRSGALHFRRPEKYSLYTRLSTAGVKFVVGDNFQSQPCKRILRHVAEKRKGMASSNRTRDTECRGCK